MRDQVLESRRFKEALGMPVKRVLRHHAQQPAPARVPAGGCAVATSRSSPATSKKLRGLEKLDAGDGWLRQKFGELGVLEYETWEDTGAEYERMQLDQAV